MCLAYRTRNIHNNYCVHLLGVKANLFACLAYRTRYIHNNYSALLLGVKADLFCVLGL